MVVSVGSLIVWPTAPRSSTCPPAIPIEPQALAIALMTSRLFGVRRWQFAGQNFECQSLQRVTGQNGSGFIECPVTGGSAAPQVIIIHGRQVIMNQGIGMDKFNAPRRRVELFKGTPERFACCINEHRPNPLAAGQ